MHAEQAYLFRHALLRDAAYQLQMPGDRARLHVIAMDVIEGLGVNSTLDPFAAELAAHARVACDFYENSLEFEGLSRRELLYLGVAAKHAAARLRHDDAAAYFDQIAAHRAASPALRYWARLEAARVLVHAGAHVAALERARAAIAAAGREHCEEDSRSLDREAEPASYRAQVALALARTSLPGLVSHALALEYEASCLLRTEQPGQALAPIEQALQTWARIADPWGVGQILNLKGITLRRVGKLHEAVAALEAAVAKHRASGRRRLEGVAMANLGAVYIDLEEYERAEAMLVQAITIHRETDGARSVALALSNLAALNLYREQPQRSLEPARQAIAIFEDRGDRAGRAVATLNLARALSKTGEFEQALQHALRSAEELLEQGRHGLRGDALAVAAESAWGAARTDEARMLAANARASLDKSPVRREPATLAILARIESAGRPEA